ncbi:PEP-CTERM sorting domain-containing protein [Rhodoferax sp. 4810]|nr:PEP-CTERM sorting domain-containing protein [Rhodoferax jenense]
MKLYRILAALALALAASSGAQATLLSVLLRGGSITAGDKLFDNWSQPIFSASDSARSFNADNIDVTALNGGGLTPGPGLKFTFLNGELSVAGDNSYAYIDLTFGFLASGLGINGSSQAFGAGGAYWSINSDLSNNSGSSISEKMGTALNLEDLGKEMIEFSVLDGVGSPVSQQTSSASFAPQNSVWVTNNIKVWATDASDSAGLFYFEQRFSQTSIPEPGTLWLLGLAFVGMSLVKVRRK